VIREVTTDHIIHTIAGTGKAGFSGDSGPATRAQLNGPIDVTVGQNGGIYIVDSNNNRIREIDNGTINTIAGTGAAGFSGDNGAATSAQLNRPGGVAVDVAGNVFIADESNNRIREINNRTSIITTIGGTGSSTDSGDGTSTGVSAGINKPTRLTIDSSGNLYFSEEYGNVVREIDNTGYIYAVVGTGTCSSTTGDGGPGSQASLCAPHGVTFDKGQSQLFIADTGHYRLRKSTVASYQ